MDPTLQRVTIEKSVEEQSPKTVLYDSSVIPSSTSRPLPLDPYDGDYPEGGRGWLVVLGCFLQATITLGWPLAWGVFQQYYKETRFHDVSDSLLSFLGATQGAVMPITSFVFGKLEDRYGYRPFVVLGSVLSFLSMFCTAWSTELWHFFMCHGVLVGLANGILFPIICAYPSQWFKRRRAFTTGIVIAGSSVGGGCTSLVLRAMLSRLSLRKTMLIYSGIDAVILIISFILVKDRPRPPVVLPSSASSVTAVAPSVKRRIQWIDSTQFRDSVFWSMAIALLIITFGYQPPYFFGAVYTRDKVPDISHSLSTLPIAVMNFSAAIGRTLVGFTADRWGPVNTILISVVLSGLVQIIIWNLANSYATIMVFAIFYGFFGGCFVSLLSPCAAQLFGAEKLANLSGLLILSNLPGYVAGPTLAGVVLGASNRNWHVVTIYSGGAQILGSVIFLYARFKRERKIWVAF